MTLNAHDVIIKPVITEKSMDLMADNKYTFHVATAATKPDIKRSVEEVFDVVVTRVNTMNMPGKNRTMGRFQGRTPAWKKAIVQLAEGDEIDFFEGML